MAGWIAGIARVVPFFKGATWEGLGDNGKQWPIKEGCAGTEILHTDIFKRGLGKFHFFGFQESNEIVQHHGEFPFLLTTGRVLEHDNCGTMTRRTAHARRVTEDVLFISSADAKKQITDAESLPPLRRAFPTGAPTASSVCQRHRRAGSQCQTSSTLAAEIAAPVAQSHSRRCARWSRRPRPRPSAWSSEVQPANPRA